MDHALAGQRGYDYSDYLENYYVSLINQRRKESITAERNRTLEIESILMLPSPQKERAFIEWCFESL